MGDELQPVVQTAVCFNVQIFSVTVCNVQKSLSVRDQLAAFVDLILLSQQHGAVGLVINDEDFGIHRILAGHVHLVRVGRLLLRVGDVAVRNNRNTCK